MRHSTFVIKSCARCQFLRFLLIRSTTPALPALIVAINLLQVLFAPTAGGQTHNSAAGSPPPELVLQTGHSMKVNAVALNANNRALASASADNTIRLWDVGSGRELRTLTGHGGWVKCVAFSFDGKLLASGSNDRSVRLWDVETGRELYLLTGHSAPVEALAFSADGRLVASGSADNTVKLWENSTGRAVNTLKGHSDWVTGVTFSADGKWLATGSKDNTVRLWEVATGREVRVLKGHTDRIGALAFSPDGQWLATGSFDHTVKLWKTAGGKEGRTLNGDAGNVIAVAFTADSRQLLSASYNKTVKLWDVHSGRQLRSAGDAASIDFVESIAFAADGQSFASSADKAVELYDSSTGKKLRTFDSRAAGFYAVSFSANGRWLASGSKDKTIRLWDTATGRQMPALVGHTGYVTSIAFSKDARWLASASLDKTIRIWDTTTEQETRKLTGHEDTVDAVAFSPDDRWLASAGYDKTVRVWDVAQGRESRKLLGHAGEVTTVAFSADGRRLASGSIDKTVRIWDTASWAEPRIIDISQPVNTIAFSPDNKWLAAGSSDKTIRFFEVASGHELRMVQSESGEIRSLAFSPDSRWLASAGSDKKITLWNAFMESQPRVLLGHSDSVNAIAFTPDGKWLASSGEDGSTALWDTETAKKVATLISLRESDDWLVITPDGLFDGSPASWNQILWRFAGNTFTFAPVEVFFNEFYYPGLLAEILNGKKPHALQDISQKDRRQPQVNLALATPTNESGVTNRTVMIKIYLAEAKSDGDHPTGSGVRDVRLFRNGSLVRVWHGDLQLDSNGKAELQTTMSLVSGTDNLIAYAFNRDNIKSIDAKLSLVGDEKLKRGGTAYILIAGVNQYANAEYNLRYAVADAEDFGAELQRAQSRLRNFAAIEVIPLLDGKATKANMMLALRRLAESDDLPSDAPKALEKIKPAQPEDAVVIYFAGHGTAPKDGRFYLIPHDLGYSGPRTKLDPASLQTILEHSISDRELEQALERIDAGQFLLVIDACNSGQALEAEEKRRGPMNSKGLAQLAYEKGMYILTAAQSYQVALERRRLSHGFLTYALVEEGLKTQAADTNPKDGQITLQEWLDYAVGRVPQMQAGAAKDTQGRLLEQEEEAGKKKEHDVQRPRVFYRLGLETKQLIVAKPGS